MLAKLTEKLHPRQAELVQKALRIRGPVFLAMDTGTGKTLTGMSIVLQEWAEERSGLGLIVAPDLVLMTKWKKELEAMGEKAYILSDKKDLAGFQEAIDTDTQWVIVPYNALIHSLRRPLYELAGRFSHMIFDEAHKVKGIGTARHKTWSDFIKDNYRARIEGGRTNGRILMLTATPIVHNPEDIQNQYRFCGLGREIEPHIDYEVKTKADWASGTDRIIGKKPCGWKDTDAVERLLDKRFIRCRKEEVFPEGDPPMISREIGIDLGSAEDVKGEMLASIVKEETSEDVAQAWEFAIDAALAGEGTSEAMAELAMELNTSVEVIPLLMWGQFVRAEGRLIAAKAAYHIAELARHEKVVVFANNKPPLAAVAKHLDVAGIIHVPFTGEVPKKKREVNRLQFTEGSAQVILCTVACAGHGIEFTPAKRLVVMQRCVAPGDWKQARDRISRMNNPGQKWVDTCVGTIDGARTRMEGSLSSIIGRKKMFAAEIGLEGTLD